MTTPSDKALANALHCEAKKHAYRQTQDGVVVSFVLHPQEVPDGLATAALGTRYMVALVEIGDDEQPVQKPSPPIAIEVPAKGKMEWRELQPSAQAALQCKKPKFWAFLREECGQTVSSEDDAATAVRKMCGVNTRGAFNTNHAARVYWHQLDSKFDLWEAMERAS